ncbi:MAG TPA: WxcM-like domain-containing protein, partial [Leeuwenhoekiella sp.]|nr:WxcM-like domain-containing protein [Leeuwenhoekiella sp.]
MKPHKIKIPKIEDPRGNLAVIEKDVIPFTSKRVYYLFDVPSGASRG